MRPWIDPVVDGLAGVGHRYCIRANTVTWLGFVCGLLAMTAVAYHTFGWALVFFAMNRLFDGLDGALARQQALTDFGGFLDISLDFIIYSGMVFSFAWAFPAYAWWSSLCLFSMVGPMVSFLTYAIITAKRQIPPTQIRGLKSFHHLGGLCEGSETIIFLVCCCWFPDFFVWFTVVFSVMCWLTTFGRMVSAYRDFRVMMPG